MFNLLNVLLLYKVLIMIFRLLEKLKHSSCIIKEKFHIYCPGCGGTRALEALLKGNPVHSLYYNPMIIILIIYIVSIVITRILESRNNDKNYYQIRKYIRVFTLLIWLVYFIARNILLRVFGIDLLGDFS